MSGFDHLFVYVTGWRLLLGAPQLAAAAAAASKGIKQFNTFSRLRTVFSICTTSLTFSTSTFCPHSVLPLILVRGRIKNVLGRETAKNTCEE